MANGEVLYLFMILAAFGVFALTLEYATWKYHQGRKTGGWSANNRNDTIEQTDAKMAG